MIPDTRHVQWSYSTSIYEVNTRQYTQEGTFNAFRKHLPRLWDMGVETLWFMPVTPISLIGRKGSLGSYYACSDYKEINPEFGTLEDFTSLVTYAHTLKFKVIIDWVANHTGNDHVWLKDHPDFFTYDGSGNIVHPNGWEDVSKLDFNNREMRAAMTEAMKFWITACDIDGFRCDMAHLVPLDFWQEASKQLNAVKPLFWLAECEEAAYHDVFDATYTWKWMHATESYYKNEISLASLTGILTEYHNSFPENAFRTWFTSNHDENSWNGTEYEKYGPAAKLLAVFSCTWNGVPMLYSGQELPNYKRLLFFDKDVIEWNDCGLHHFYKTLLELRSVNPALWAMSLTEVLPHNAPEKVFAFQRIKDQNSAVIILNLSSDNVAVELNITGSFRNVFTTALTDFPATLILEPWGYRVMEKVLLSPTK